MHRWLSVPVFNDVETTRRARLLRRLLFAMALLSLLGAGSALLDSSNDPRVTLLFYGIVWVWFGVVFGVVRTGRVVLAAWVFSLFFWALIATVMLLFGGMQGQNASVFAVCTLLVGSVIGGRPALWMALMSSLWCAFVAYLEVTGKLPSPIGPYTPVNAWGAVTITVLLTSVLLQVSLESLQHVHTQAQRSAAERDEALRKSIHGQKMELVGNLTSGVAHDLNNLLTVITGTSDILRSQVAAGDEDAKSLLDELDAATSRASLMTRQLLNFGRVSSNDSECVDFGAVLSAMGQMLPRLLGSALIVNVKTVSGCWVQGSRSGLEQIVLNLAVNARDAMPSGGELELELAREGKDIFLQAKDTGVGMSQTVQDRIFEPFFTTKATGTGLGLSTIRTLAEGYGGSISVESKIGVGSTFRLKLPLRAPAAVAKSSDRLPVSNLENTGDGRPRILLVEDDPLVRSAIARGLGKDGFDVVTASDGVDAVAKLTKLPQLHCIVSDVAMPHMDGEALARHIADTRPELPMVLVSGNQEPASALLPGLPRAFLMKPVTREALRAAISAVTTAARD